MTHLLMIAAGGAAGALCRYGLVNWINGFAHSKTQWGSFPLGTLSVNVIGSFAIGIMYVLIAERMALHADWRNVAIIGFLGAFTTFSTFSLETITLLENGQFGHALIYIVSSLMICIIAAWLAIYLTRLL
ncbi:fluoride efflux transporter CrcB [Oceanicoccus sagamiensis]|uniref:Fluoride-specific ion channel FluC n=1 Tax=Oceanicoccus sagamiensis TaxID=716816 RepID=A0A1X9NJZ5_9GAMM|nr:fluoride efflux transporter CrcB [Oceanicoccus sagamiensis]ARN75779.1 camphor resistance protein CrcB [Oceanicoccus sagamiensis]